MAIRRLEPYRHAVTDLRDRLRTGVLAPGTRIVAKDVSEDLGLSPTPVREAMARLAGEGLLVERRGDGFFVRVPTAPYLAELYRLSLVILLEAQQGERRPRPDLSLVLGGEAQRDPVRAVERLFLAWAGESEGTALGAFYGLVLNQLGPVRRVEAQLLPDLAAEAQALVALAEVPNDHLRRDALTEFHARRVPFAAALAQLLAPADDG
ncbi:MAG: hypothetical protein A2790_20205 [Phenylobacterium sp. RIFCSPHIGHO2_01_FULL_69_31]|nr:MAG: hypothetical protein A2790_20205 [Phenylobacterium sp. RIFCSPHIGHO2_01_FULL_69_31]